MAENDWSDAVINRHKWMRNNKTKKQKMDAKKNSLMSEEIIMK